jgi:hypothetical protein
MSGNVTGGGSSDTAFNTQLNQVNKLLVQLVTSVGKLASPTPAAGSLGSYVLAKSSAIAAFGAILPGADLTPSNAAGTATGAALTGTWQCMGVIGAGGDVSLFARVT